MEKSFHNMRVALVCPSCHGALVSTSGDVCCKECGRRYRVNDGVPNFLQDAESDDVQFYEEWHKEPHRAYNLNGIGTVIKTHAFINRHKSFFKYVLYTQFRREQFFRTVSRYLRKSFEHPLILDLGCGGGNPELLQSGEMYGIDYSASIREDSLARRHYALLVNGNATQLPFGAETFDCIVSSDFIGHIPPREKEKLFSEMNRVTKKGGLSAHVIETSSDNCINRFAQRHGELYQRYFIEGAGGHFGLERPSVVLQRFLSSGFTPVLVKKYYSYLWDIESFIALFDNEYREKSPLVKTVLNLYTVLCRNFVIKVFSTAVLGFFSYLVDVVTPLDKAEGIMVICRKER